MKKRIISLELQAKLTEAGGGHRFPTGHNGTSMSPESTINVPAVQRGRGMNFRRNTDHDFEFPGGGSQPNADPGIGFPSGYFFAGRTRRG